MQCELRNVKIMKSLSQETECFSAKLYIDGKPAATVENRGCGGPNETYFKDPVLEQKFYDYCKSLPNEPSEHFPEGLTMDSDLLVSNLLERFQRQKLCKKKIVFTLKDQPHALCMFNIPYSPESKAMVEKKYGTNLKSIINEELERAVS